MTPYPFPVNEGLRRRLDVMIALEGLGLVLGLQVMILDDVALALQQILGFQTEGACVLRHDHAVENGGFVAIFWHGCLQSSELHLLFDARADQPPVDGVRGDKSAQHGNLHHEPELDTVGAQLCPEEMREDPEMRDGHKPVHADLP